METTEKWLEEKISNYNENPKEALEDMLYITNNAIKQFINNPDSYATKGLLKSCMLHNKLFLEKIGY